MNPIEKWNQLSPLQVILESRLAESQMMMKKVLEEFKKQHEYFTSVRSNSSQSLPPPPSSLDESSLKELHSAR